MTGRGRGRGRRPRRRDVRRRSVHARRRRRVRRLPRRRGRRRVTRRIRAGYFVVTSSIRAGYFVVRPGRPRAPAAPAADAAARVGPRRRVRPVRVGTPAFRHARVRRRRRLGEPLERHRPRLPGPRGFGLIAASGGRRAGSRPARVRPTRADVPLVRDRRSFGSRVGPRVYIRNCPDVVRIAGVRRRRRRRERRRRGRAARHPLRSLEDVEQGHQRGAGLGEHRGFARALLVYVIVVAIVAHRHGSRGEDRELILQHPPPVHVLPRRDVHLPRARRRQRSKRLRRDRPGERARLQRGVKRRALDGVGQQLDGRVLRGTAPMSSRPAPASLRSRGLVSAGFVVGEVITFRVVEVGESVAPDARVGCCIHLQRFSVRPPLPPRAHRLP